jgi:hypothetical protein
MVENFDELEFIKLLEKLSIIEDKEVVFSFNANHFLIIMMIAKKNKKVAERYYKNKIGFKREEVKELIHHEYLIPLVPGEYDLYNFVVSSEVLTMLIAGDDEFEEFFQAFPKTFLINGIITSARNCDYDRLKTLYLKLIKGNKLMHNKILQSVEIYKKMLKDGLTNPMGITKFVDARNYETYFELVEEANRGLDDDNAQTV